MNPVAETATHGAAAEAGVMAESKARPTSMKQSVRSDPGLRVFLTVAAAAVGVAAETAMVVGRKGHPEKG